MSQWRVPLFDCSFGEKELAAVQKPLRDGWVTMGPITAELEAEFQRRTGSAHAVAVASGTAALHLALAVAGVGPGDEVICPTLTFVATANAVRYVGARCVFCESIGPEDLNVDPDDAASRITPRTRAIMVVHYGGFPADLPRLKKLADAHGLLLAEDCAHALFSTLAGRVCGTWGNFGAFSFFSNKNMTSAEGGVITTNDGPAAERLRRMRSHGMTTLTLDRHKGRAFSYDVVDLGFNYRIDEIRSSLALAQLSRLDDFLDARARVRTLYEDRLADLPVVLPDFRWKQRAEPGDRVGHHILPVLLPEGCNRHTVMTRMKQAGVQTSVHYRPVHTFSSFRAENPDLVLPRTEALADRQLTLPFYPGLTEQQVDYVCRNLAEAL